jgi:hypothetical protein
VARRAHARFRDIELLGFTPPDPAVNYVPGSRLPLTLLWQNDSELGESWQVTLWLEGDRRYPLAEVPLGGHFPISRWGRGQTVRQWPALLLPEDLPTGVYQLTMRVSRSGQPVPWGRWLIPLGSDLDLGPVQIRSE